MTPNTPRPDRMAIGASPLPPVFGHWVRLDAKWSCQFSLVRGRLDCAWNARRPPTAKQMLKILDAYRRARNEFAVSVLEKVGVRLVMIDDLGTAAR